MRLKCIKLAGFKSFVDPTTVPFTSNLSAVVGPNGCGKSNIIDAVRWVMGESSAKHLRGESMTDVIFNGSTGRKPVGQASIELVFDNSDGTLVGEYAKFSEISVKRKVTREGQSSYFLNNTRCRRRDITDIFLGTGLGPRSYAIIEQGMISRLIESKPEELRVNLEEAAGISKYKERRKETESRMRRTLDNLERLNDLREELGRQLQHLHKQAQSAEKYKELKTQERLFKAQLLGLRWQQLSDEITAKNQVVVDFEVKHEAFIADQRAADAIIEESREKQIDLTDKFNVVQSEFYSVGNEIARLEQSIQYQTERFQQLHDDLEEADTNLQDCTEEREQEQEKLESVQEELLVLEPELELARETETETAEHLATAEESMGLWQQHWDDFNSHAAETRQRAEVEQSRIRQLEANNERNETRLKRLQSEKEQTQENDFSEEIAVLEQQVEEQELGLETLQQRVDNASENITKNRNEEELTRRQLDRDRNQLQQLRGRKASLEALQQAALEETGGGVKKWLQRHQLQSHKRLAETIQASDGWGRAVETVLGSNLQAICVDSLEPVNDWLASLSKGSVSFLEQQAAVLSRTGSNGTPLETFVSAPDAVKALLAGIYAVDDLPEALALRSKLDPHESVVTKDGIWIGPSWLRVIRETDASSGVLERKQELERLEEELDTLDERVEEQETTLETVRLHLKNAEQEKETAQRELTVASRQLGDLQAKMSSKQARVEQILLRKQQLDSDITELSEQLTVDVEELATAKEVWREALERMEEDTLKREELEAQREGYRQALENAKQRAKQDQDRSHQIAMRHQSLTMQLSNGQQTLERLMAQIERAQMKKAELQEQLSQTDTPVDSLKQDLETALQSRLVVEKNMNETKAQLDACEHTLRSEEKKRSDAERKSTDVRSALEKERMAVQAIDIRRNSFVEQLQEMEQSLDAVLSQLPPEAEIDAWDQELEKIGNRIQRLGAINLAAIDEYKSQSARKEYLDAQNNDLEKALQTLENAIEKIDRETRDRFKDTFDRVNQGLQELFPKVFGGGSAYLELTTDDLLNTGVAIMARPPGKKNSTIHLLSGGEKALTAIAMVFSIFRLNPAPFCMLDEVDAPLDDANVGRYARLVKAMSSQVQFIYITHNKIAMEMADNLMGVTMHEPGVSRLVAVNVEEAAELVAS